MKHLEEEGLDQINTGAGINTGPALLETLVVVLGLTIPFWVMLLILLLG